ncbi:Hypothetical predicted protein [Podarcis lilfordi]|uniref:Uncharacterized protein n=1 Tax=Podarcis lilfordi TaxID=74358 RepID=A0AA35LEP1_9SAUR|nr:Hypothetical predicted protein [Podarcis lilfordi]
MPESCLWVCSEKQTLPFGFGPSILERPFSLTWWDRTLSAALLPKTMEVNRKGGGKCLLRDCSLQKAVCQEWLSGGDGCDCKKAQQKHSTPFFTLFLLRSVVFPHCITGAYGGICTWRVCAFEFLPPLLGKHKKHRSLHLENQHFRGKCLDLEVLANSKQGYFDRKNNNYRGAFQNRTLPQAHIPGWLKWYNPDSQILHAF